MDPSLTYLEDLSMGCVKHSGILAELAADLDPILSELRSPFDEGNRRGGGRSDSRQGRGGHGAPANSRGKTCGQVECH